jgi:HipA-like C-terminal domain
MNLPERYLFQRIVERAGKQALTKMHLLALIFEPLVDAYMGQSIGVAGVQPKLMLPSRASIAVPDLMVKTAGTDFPGLAANEYLCLSAAKAAGLQVPLFALNDDASMLLIDRFDLQGPTRRLGFEDIAALMGLRVHDRLSNRKYQGSYEDVAEVVRLMGGRHVKARPPATSASTARCGSRCASSGSSASPTRRTPRVSDKPSVCESRSGCKPTQTAIRVVPQYGLQPQ